MRLVIASVCAVSSMSHERHMESLDRIARQSRLQADGPECGEVCG